MKKSHGSKPRMKGYVPRAMTKCLVHDCHNDAVTKHGTCSECAPEFEDDRNGRRTMSAFMYPPVNNGRRVPKKPTLEQLDMDASDDWYR